MIWIIPDSNSIMEKRYDIYNGKMWKTIQILYSDVGH